MIFKYIQDERHVEGVIDLFLEFVGKQPEQCGIKVSFENGYLEKQEGYKRRVISKAVNALNVDEWDRKSFTPEKIIESAMKSFGVTDRNQIQNLVDWRNADDFRKKLAADVSKGAQFLVEFYSQNTRGEDDFAKAIKFAGRHFDLVSWLFCLKKQDSFFPWRPMTFARAFARLQLATDCCSKCTYQNYLEFNNVLRELAALFSEHTGLTVTTLDAHSFAWIIGREESKAWHYITGENSKTVKRLPAKGPKQEGQAVVKTRKNQTQYRSSMVDYWGGRCAVTGCKQTDLLIASHAKPWKDCLTNDESANPYNGFLLIPNLDALFDAGLISFDDEGKIVISNLLDERDRRNFGLHDDMRLSKIDTKHLPFLHYHRKHIFKKG